MLLYNYTGSYRISTTAYCIS